MRLDTRSRLWTQATSARVILFTICKRCKTDTCYTRAISTTLGRRRRIACTRQFTLRFRRAFSSRSIRFSCTSLSTICAMSEMAGIPALHATNSRLRNCGGVTLIPFFHTYVIKHVWMQTEDVLRCSQEFIDVMSDVTDPRELAFSAYTKGPPLQQIVEQARNRCQCDPDAAVASITIASGNENSFVIKGSHALGTIRESDRSGRLWLIALAAVIIAVAIVVLLKCR